MPKIHQLSLQEIQKIAAGEVIDRPANIVKELVENSIDAGASHIKICIEDGGKKLVRIIDNGCGMAPDDAKLCFAHHATSKITTLNDLEHCTTHGFRGEALSSIASVSHITIVTKPEYVQLATKLVLHGGTITEETSVGANIGTDMSVQELFYNIPARKKFLKTRETEWRQILRLVQAYCLEYKHIHFELFCQGDSIINCPPTESLEQRIAQVWDYDMSKAMIPVSIQDDHQHITISGVVSHHHYAKYDRSNIFMFVNHRWVKNQHLCKALLKAYANVLPPARYPVAVLSITVEQSTVDINIHPRKEEVKFLHPHAVESLISDCTKQALEAHVSKKLISPQHEQKNTASVTPVMTMQAKAKSLYQPTPLTVQATTQPRMHNTLPVLGPAIESIKEFEEQPASFKQTIFATQAVQEPLHHDTNLTVEDRVAEQETPVTIIGQYKRTYIIIEEEAGLLLIDQHAAHERILYEQFATRFEDIATVRLLFPIIINLTAEDFSLLEPHMGILHAHGIVLEPFGQYQLRVTSTPVHLQHADMADLVKQCISWLHTHDQTDMYQYLTDQLRALMACKAAVKAGDILNKDQMQQIVKDLAHTANKLTCPHGRPTNWTIEQHEIEKKFKRDYRTKPRELLD
jgi:DNA mismatch repair protein MutL